MLQPQFEAVLARHAPDVAPGRPNSGAALVLADALQVDRRASAGAPERFDAIVVEEFHPGQLPRVRGILALHPEARVLEVSCMPRPFPGAIEPEAEVDLSDEPTHALAGLGR